MDLDRASGVRGQRHCQGLNVGDERSDQPPRLDSRQTDTCSLDIHYALPCLMISEQELSTI